MSQDTCLDANDEIEELAVEVTDIAALSELSDADTERPIRSVTGRANKGELNTPARVRDLARQGELAAYFEMALDEQRHRLRIEAHELTHPVVFDRLSRPHEARRGYRDCKVSAGSLRPDRLDGFHDDLDAVLDDLFRNARMPILRLESRVAGRLTAETIHAHRRRRGERGALQRPRIPKWLAEELHHDEQLAELAIKMLEWVDYEASARIHDWPAAAWTAQRVAAGTDCEGDARIGPRHRNRGRCHTQASAVTRQLFRTTTGTQPFTAGRGPPRHRTRRVGSWPGPSAQNAFCGQPAGLVRIIDGRAYSLWAYCYAALLNLVVSLGNAAG